MSEKSLTELPWKTLATKQGVKEIGLGKALAVYTNLNNDKEPAKALEQLRLIADLVVKLKKTNPAGKDVLAYLEEVLKEAKKTIPALEARIKSAAAKGGDDQDGDERQAAEFKKDLKKQLANALAQVKLRAPGTDQQPKPQLQFLAYLAGKNSAVIVAGRTGSATRKLLLEIAGNASGGKFLQGECLFEKGAHTFVLDNAPGGLARILSAALLAETGIKFKVRVRSADGSVVDSDADTEASPAEKSNAGQGNAEGLYRALLARIPADLQRLRTVDPAAAERIQKMVDAAAILATKKDYPKAFAQLDQASKTLQQGGAGAVVKADLAKAQARWEAGVTAARASVKPVQAGLKAEFAAAAGYIDNILNSYRRDLSALFQAAQAVQDQPSIDTAVKGVLAKLQQLRAEIAGDALFAYLAERGIKVRQDFQTALDQVQALL